MKQKIIIANKGRANEGKTESIKFAAQYIIDRYPNTKIEWLCKGGDIKVIVNINNIKIGVESQGDPNSRLFKSLDDFTKVHKCEIIICSTRTGGDTVHAVNKLSSEYEVIWVANPRSCKIDHNYLNQLFAEQVFQIVKSFITPK